MGYLLFNIMRIWSDISPMFHIDDNEVSWGKQRQSDSTCQLPCRRTLLGHSAKIGCKSLRKPEDSYF